MNMDDLLGFLIAIPFGLFVAFVIYTAMFAGVEAMLYR